MWDRNVDRLKILVIDDSALNRKMVIKVIAGKSVLHECVECDGGASALVCMKNNLTGDPPDLSLIIYTF